MFTDNAGLTCLPAEQSVFGKAGSFVFRDFLDAQLDAATSIQVHHFDQDILTLAEVLRNVFYAIRRDLRNVNQSILARQNRYERTKINDARYFTLIDSSHFGFGGNALDQLNRLVA